MCFIKMKLNLYIFVQVLRQIQINIECINHFKKFQKIIYIVNSLILLYQQSSTLDNVKFKGELFLCLFPSKL